MNKLLNKIYEGTYWGQHDLKQTERARQPILQSGQHRRQALLSALEDQAAAAIKNATDVNGEKIEHPRPEAYVWAVDLYDEDAMDNDLLSALRANRVDSFKANTEGRTVAILIRWWSDELSEQERQRYSKPIAGVIIGALFLINILVRGDFFSQAGTNAKDQDLIWNKEEWNNCLRALREAADIISKWDWEPKVDDIDEFLGQYTLSLDAQIRRDLEQWQATHAENLGLSTKLPGEKEPDRLGLS
ncbi:hypothetical protein DTO212C5_2752 [Paecilomyces variotii]|nr:hypothetical protein DTO212C5_2752 [Paecilomyces variotii]